MDFLSRWTGGRYRLPDLSRIWSGAADDVTDHGATKDKSVIQRLERHLVRAQVGAMHYGLEAVYALACVKKSRFLIRFLGLCVFLKREAADDVATANCTRTLT